MKHPPKQYDQTPIFEIPDPEIPTVTTMRNHAGKIHSKNIEELEREMGAWVSGVTDEHDLVVQKVKEVATQSDEVTPRLKTWLAKDQSRGFIPMSGYVRTVQPLQEKANFTYQIVHKDESTKGAWTVSSDNVTVTWDTPEMDGDTDEYTLNEGWYLEEEKHYQDTIETLDNNVGGATFGATVPPGNICFRADGDVTVQGNILDLDVDKIQIWGMEIDRHRGHFYINRVIPFFFTTALIFWWMFALIAMWASYKYFGFDLAVAEFIKLLSNP